MRENKKIKYKQITEDFKKSIDWQDLLKLNLKNQDEIIFIDTPNL